MPNIKLVFKQALRDLGRQKVRSLVGIFGVCISVASLTVVLFISDSISFTFVDYLSTDAGNQDMNLTVRHYAGEPVNRSNYFYYQPLIDQIEAKTGKIENFIPRMDVSGFMNASGMGNVPKRYERYYSYMTIYGINISLENKLNFGQLIDPITELELSIENLPINHCIVHKSYNDVLDFKIGEEISTNLTLYDHTGYQVKHVNLTVDAIFDFNEKWPEYHKYSNLIVVDIKTLYQLFGFEEYKGRCEELILTLKDNEVYDIRQIEASKETVKDIAAEVLMAVGIEEYNIVLPKLSVLEESNVFTMSIAIIFFVVTIIGMVITGILINGILTTSVEERIREFGINRTLGAKRSYNLYLVLVQSFLLCNFGTIIGILLAYFASQYLLIPILSSYLIGYISTGIEFSYTLQSILIAYMIGIGVGLIVSLSPAVKVMRLQLIESIHPYRHEDTLYHLQKRSTLNYKLIMVGVILALNGGFIYFIVPRVLITLNFTLMALTLVVILLIFIMGLTLAGLGIIPVIIRAVISAFRPLTRKLHHIIKIFVFRFQRRNSSTIVIFALSFSFVIFTSTVIRTISSFTEDQIRVENGSDLVLWNRDFLDYEQESTDATRMMNTDIIEELMAIEGVEKVSSVLIRPNRLEDLYEKSYGVEISAYPALSSHGVALLNIDEAYSKTVDSDWIKFKEGNSDEVFNKLFAQEEQSFPCVISEGIANQDGYVVGDKIKMKITRGKEVETYPFIIVGIASSLSGFFRQFGDSLVSSGNGVLISQEIYRKVMDLPEPTWIERIFIKVNEMERIQRIRNQINGQFKDVYDFYIVNLEQRIENQSTMFTMIDVLFTAVLMSTLVICIFGLLASSYSTIIERKKDVAVLRTLGLKGKEINKLFILEAMIIMISSGIIGSLSGWVSGTLLSTSINLMLGIPYKFTFPLTNFLYLVLFSVTCIYVGMKFMLHKLKKSKIIDIYRETT